MDREISQNVVSKRRKKLITKIILISSVVIILLVLLVGVLETGVYRKDITIANVEMGDLEIAVVASGSVVPSYEEIITSPIPSKVLEIYKNAGDSLKLGDPILKLDLASFKNEYEQQQDEVEMKKAKMNQEITNNESELADIAMQIDVDKMKLQRINVQLKNELYLDSVGSSTPDKVRQAELEYKVQEIQVNQLINKLENKKRNFNAEVKVLELELKIAEKKATLAEKTMDEAQIKSTQNSVLTWVVDRVGLNIAAGEKVAVVSDTKTFKVECTISNNFTDNIKTGGSVNIKIANTILTGVIGNVIPSSEDGLTKFSVSINDSENDKLRPGLKVDVFVIKEIHDNVLKLPNRSYYNGKGAYDMWVVDGNYAIKKQITLGDSNFDMVEVITGLESGNEVIVSDMSRYRNENKLKIRN